MKTFDITIAGELNLDLILYGLPAEMPTERELLATDFCVTLGSSSAIVAHNAAVLGAKVAFTTLVGADDFGRMALARLSEAGVDVSHAKEHPTRATGVTVLLPHGEHRHILTFPGTMAELSVHDLEFDFLVQSRHLHISSIFLQRGLHDGLADLLRRIKAAGLTISLDSNDDPDDQWGSPLAEILPYVDLFLPNEDEICRMTKTSNVDEAVRALAVRPPVIVVKRGARGARVYEQDKVTDVPGLKVTPIDTIGAGDSFDAGFLRGFLHSRAVTVCAQLGNITGALSTQGAGGTGAYRDSELRDAFLREHRFFELLQTPEVR